MKNITVLRKALQNLNSKFIQKGQIYCVLHRFSNYPITDSENNVSFKLSGNYYGVDCFAHGEGIYYNQERDLFFYVGLSSPDKFSNIISAFPIKDDMLSFLTTELKIRIIEASLSRSRISVSYTELPNLFECLS